MADVLDAPEVGSENGEGTVTNGHARRVRRARTFPALSFAEARALPEAIQEHGAGQAIRRTTLFDKLQRSPEGGTTRKLITASVQYGLTKGSYSADVLELTEKGRLVTEPEAAGRRKARAEIELAIEGVAPFKAIWDRYSGSRLPSVEVLRDAAREAGVDGDQLAECVETFLANARGVGLIRNIAGSERLLSLDDALDTVTDRTGGTSIDDVDLDQGLAEPIPQAPALPTIAARVTESIDLDRVCFVVSPIGDEGSEQRLHADLVLGSLIEPALRELGLETVRADKISKPGLITGQVIDHLTRAKMVIADLSFANPNVYYELALRHAIRRPVVQIIRASDRLPFDVGQFRTVEIDMSSIYTLVPALDLHRQEIARQCRAALEEGETAESPLSQFYPRFWEHLPRSRAAGTARP